MTPGNEHSMTATRREALRRIIGQSAVGRQADLVRLLRKTGHPATQSSVSRDLRELGVAKLGDRYVMPDDAQAGAGRLDSVAGFVRQVRPAGPHLTVVRTAVGTAQSVAIALDRTRWTEIVGTVAGDDTIFVATASATAQRKLLARLHQTFGI